MEVTIKGQKFNVQGDTSFWKVAHDWETASFQILEKFLNKQNTFIDVGTWNGVLSMYASRLCKNVIGFEPEQTAYSNAVVNCGLNDITNVEIYNVGVSNKEGTQQLFIRNEGDSVSSLIDRHMEGYESKKVKEIRTIRLSKFLSSTSCDIGLIKMDIEGGEVYAIPELATYLKENKPPLYISFHPNWFENKEIMIKYFADMLFSVYKCYTRHFEQVDKKYFVNALNGTEHCFIFVK